MKVLLTDCKILKLKFPTFREWERAMVDKYGLGIIDKTNEIWNLILEKELIKISSKEFREDALGYKKKIQNFNQWQKELTNKYGEDIKFHLMDVWNRIDVIANPIPQVKKTAPSTEPNNPNVKSANYLSDDDLFDRKMLFWSKLICSTLLFVALLKLPMVYYNLMKFALCGTACFVAIRYYYENEELTIKAIIFGAIGIIFNPFIPLYIGKKSVWSVIDVIVAIIFLGSISYFREFPFRLKKEKI
ncbi:MAG: DUF6804 family protein [Ignavibacteriaceae bacterium]